MATEQLMTRTQVTRQAIDQGASTAFHEAPPDSLWHVLHTRSRQEKRLAVELGQMDVPCFLPMIRAVRYHGRRKTMIEEPLFPNYLFLRGSREQAFDADRTGRVARVIPVSDQQRIEWELKNLWLALRKGAPLDPYPFLRKGVRVEVRSGPFRGLQGVIEDRTGPDRLILQVDMLGRAVSLEVEGALLEPID